MPDDQRQGEEERSDQEAAIQRASAGPGGRRDGSPKRASARRPQVGRRHEREDHDRSGKGQAATVEEDPAKLRPGPKSGAAEERLHQRPGTHERQPRRDRLSRTGRRRTWPAPTSPQQGPATIRIAPIRASGRTDGQPIWLGDHEHDGCRRDEDGERERRGRRSPRPAPRARPRVARAGSGVGPDPRGVAAASADRMAISMEHGRA